MCFAPFVSSFLYWQLFMYLSIFGCFGWSWCRQKPVTFIPIDWSNLYSLNFLQTLKCFCANLLLFSISSCYTTASKTFRRIADAKLWIVINCNDKQQIVVVTWKSAFVFNELANKNSCIQNAKLSKQLQMFVLSPFFAHCFCFRGEKSHSKLIFVQQSISNTYMISIMRSLLNR